MVSICAKRCHQTISSLLYILIGHSNDKKKSFTSSDTGNFFYAHALLGAWEILKLN